jgi:hypothetical protein
MKFLTGVVFSLAVFTIYFAWNNYMIVDKDPLILCTLAGIIIGMIPGMLMCMPNKRGR